MLLLQALYVCISAEHLQQQQQQLSQARLTETKNNCSKFAHPTSMISKHSTIQTACRRLENLVLSSIFDASLSSLVMWNLQSYPTTVLNEWMWQFRVTKHTLTPSTYFQGFKTLTPGSTPSVVDKRTTSDWLRVRCQSKCLRIWLLYTW